MQDGFQAGLEDATAILLGSSRICEEHELGSLVC